GLVFLTLLPAIRRGPDYTRDNGSPWPWPLYPWSLFVFLAVAVMGRSFLLCSSMHLVDMVDFDRLIFGPYFLIPFGLALTGLLLEIGLTLRTKPAGEASSLRDASRTVGAGALALPSGLAVLSLMGDRDDRFSTAFMDSFTAALGGDPLYLTLLASTAFYVYAALRRAPGASEGLTAALAALAVVGPETLIHGQPTAPHPLPILAAAMLQLVLGVRHRQSWRCLLGAAGLALFVTLLLPATGNVHALRWFIAFHLALLAILIIGAIFDDAFARVLRISGAAVVLLAGLAAMFAGHELAP